MSNNLIELIRTTQQAMPDHEVQITLSVLDNDMIIRVGCHSVFDGYIVPVAHVTETILDAEDLKKSVLKLKKEIEYQFDAQPKRSSMNSQEAV